MELSQGAFCHVFSSSNYSVPTTVENLSCLATFFPSKSGLDETAPGRSKINQSGFTFKSLTFHKAECMAPASSLLYIIITKKFGMTSRYFWFKRFGVTRFTCMYVNNTHMWRPWGDILPKTLINISTRTQT